jgi:hypothetical protein
MRRRRFAPCAATPNSRSLIPPERLVDSTGTGPNSGESGEASTLADLFHRLNNQLSVILAHAELLESKAVDDQQRARASQIVASVVGAMTTTRTLRDQVDPAR